MFEDKIFSVRIHKTNKMFVKTMHWVVCLPAGGGGGEQELRVAYFRGLGCVWVGRGVVAMTMPYGVEQGVAYQRTEFASARAAP